MKRAMLPLLAFCALALVLGLALRGDPRALPSPLIGRPTPAFSLPTLLETGEARFGPATMQGQVWLLNVWASWCAACRTEHPALMALARQGDVPVVGLAYKDDPSSAQRWLNQAGDPYRVTALDRDGRVGIDLGVYGVPETYLIDQQGRVRFKQTGPLTPEVMQQQVLPLIEELRR